MSKHIKAVSLRLANLVLTISLILFSFFYISDLISQVDASDYSVNFFLLALSIICFVAYYAFMSINWLISAKMIDSGVKKEQILVFFASQPYKYLPTSLFVLSSRAVFAKKLGMSIKKSSIGQVVENASILFSNFALFGLCLAAIYNLVLAAVLTVCGVVLCMFVYRFGSFKVELKGKSLNLNSRSIVLMLVSTFVGWSFCGVSFLFVNLALGLNISPLVLFAGNTIAFSLSMLAFFAPGGIGVREVIYNRFGADSGAIILWRILVFIMDFLIGIPAILVIRKIRKSILSQGTEAS